MSSEGASPPRWLDTALVIFAKDLRIELRTREIVTTTGFFAVLVAVLGSVAFYAGNDEGARLAPGALWLSVTFASILALSRTWQRERDEGALTGLLVAPLSRSALFAGKALGVLAFLTAVELVVVPVVALLFHIDLPSIALGLAGLVFGATVGVASLGTLFGAMTVRTRARDLVLASVLLPLLSPVLVTSVAATRELFLGATWSELRSYAILLVTFDLVAIAGGLGLFGALVEE